MFYFKNNQKGFAVFFITILVIAAVSGIAISVSILTHAEQKISRNIVKSSQAYYTAESGIEDALLRLGKNKKWLSSYTFNISAGTFVQVAISSVNGGATTITARGNTADRIRIVEAVYEFSGDKPGFFYGAQVGSGGLLIENQAKVVGNVFSNGSAELKGPSAEITDTIRVAGAGNKIFGEGKVGKDGYADVCKDVKITGTLYANTVSGCSYGSLITLNPPINPIAFPITDDEIQDWKNDALSGGVIGSFTKDSGTHFLGPVKVNGNLTIQNTAQLVITGTIWVTGKINIKNSAKARLDSSYGSSSGVIVGDDLIELQNNSISSGSGKAGSYLMYLSTSSKNPAIIIKNSAGADILYSNTGWLEIQNQTDIRSVSAYGIHIKNSAALTYEIGLADAFFTSGPSAGLSITSWEEIK